MDKENGSTHGRIIAHSGMLTGLARKIITEVTAGHSMFSTLVRILKITCFLGEDDFGFPVSCWGNTGRLAL